MHKAWLLLGSNIHPERNLPRAARMIAERTRVQAASSIWQSPAADRPDQPEYWNAALLVETEFTPEEFQQRIQIPIEKALGRTRTADKSASRTIDIDLMLYDSLVGTYAEHVLPHPDILTRAFAAVPLAEISPGQAHPVSGQTLGQIAARLPDRNGLRKRDARLLP